MDREVASATGVAAQRANHARAVTDWARRAHRAAGEADHAAHRCPPARRFATAVRRNADDARREAERVEAAAR